MEREREREREREKERERERERDREIDCVSVYPVVIATTRHAGTQVEAEAKRRGWAGGW